MSSSFLPTGTNLRLVHYGISEVEDAIKAIPEGGVYDKVLTLGTEQVEAVGRAVEEKEKKFKQTSPRSKRLDPIKQVGFTMPLPKDSDLKEWYHGYPHDSARRCGFDDYYDYMRMQLYLHQNAERQLVTVSRRHIPIFHRSITVIQPNRLVSQQHSLVGKRTIDLPQYATWIFKFIAMWL